jgi:hypothetical protein
MTYAVLYVASSVEGCRCIASLGISGATYGLHCIITAIDHVHDLIVNYTSPRLAHMVFVGLF